MARFATSCRRVVIAALVVAGLALPRESAAAWAHVQTNGTETAAAGSTAAHTLTSSVTAGNHLTCGVVFTGTTFSSIASSPSNTWSSARVSVDDATFFLKVFDADNVASGSTTVTVTFSDALGSLKYLGCTEHSGVATSSAFDQSQGQYQAAPGTGTDGITTTNTGATAADNELVVGMLFTRTAAPTLNAGTNFTERLQASTAFYAFDVEDRNLATAGAVAATWTTNVDVGTASVVVTFKEPTCSASDNFLLEGSTDCILLEGASNGALLLEPAAASTAGGGLTTLGVR